MSSIAPNGLERDIIATLAYHAHFGYPLTNHEIWKWLMADQAVPFARVDECLTSSPWLRERMVASGPFFGLGDVAAQAEERRRRYVDAVRKYRKAHRFARLLRHLPGVEAVAICNSLAFHFTTSRSDIDFFVITSPKQTWTTRFLATLPAMVFRQRPGEVKEHPLCLSFFVSTEALDLSNLKLDADDPYFAAWFATLAPIVVREDVLTNLWGANGWLRQRLPNAEPVRRASAFRVRADGRARRMPWLEAWTERMQREHFPKHIRELMNGDTRVVVTNSVLKFHDNDRREEIRSAWRDRVKGFDV
ncbi:MAG: hypothetical protein NUV56_02440 [Candidatus Uhrbacteria bacterium]|nr:hypothetical protein [Candidatus Uhrbacteria bacterium]